MMKSVGMLCTFLWYKLQLPLHKAVPWNTMLWPVHAYTSSTHLGNNLQLSTAHSRARLCSHGVALDPPASHTKKDVAFKCRNPMPLSLRPCSCTWLIRVNEGGNAVHRSLSTAHDCTSSWFNHLLPALVAHKKSVAKLSRNSQEVSSKTLYSASFLLTPHQDVPSRTEALFHKDVPTIEA